MDHKTFLHLIQTQVEEKSRPFHQSPTPFRLLQCWRGGGEAVQAGAAAAGRQAGRQCCLTTTASGSQAVVLNRGL